MKKKKVLWLIIAFLIGALSVSYTAGYNRGYEEAINDSQNN